MLAVLFRGAGVAVTATMRETMLSCRTRPRPGRRTIPRGPRWDAGKAAVSVCCRRAMNRHALVAELMVPAQEDAERPHKATAQQRDGRQRTALHLAS